jgi:1-deoxy-D-xylulose 5-phosphate reductoisomerase
MAACSTASTASSPPCRCSRWARKSSGSDHECCADLRRVAVFGATGSIGASTLDVIARHPQRYQATVLAAGRQVQALLALCRQHKPAHAVIADESLFAELRDGLRDAGLSTEAHAGHAALDQLAASDACDTVVAAIVGAAGLSSTLAAAPPASASCWPTRNRWCWPASC